jgi:K+ transporter
MNNLENIPPVKWSMTHPRIAAWIVLSLGMVILLVIEARDVGLTAGNWIALIVATVLVAGACIWIVSWEDVEEEAETTTPAESDDAAEETAPEAEKTTE